MIDDSLTEKRQEALRQIFEKIGNESFNRKLRKELLEIEEREQRYKLEQMLLREKHRYDTYNI